MGQFSFWHLLMVLAIVVIFFGPSRLPSLGHSLGKAIRGFKEGMKGLDGEESEERDATNETLPPGSKNNAQKSRDKNSSNS